MDKIKNMLKGVVIVYTLLGSSYMLGQDVTGHVSADLFKQLNKLEQTVTAYPCGQNPDGRVVEITNGKVKQTLYDKDCNNEIEKVKVEVKSK